MSRKFLLERQVSWIGRGVILAEARSACYLLRSDGRVRQVVPLSIEIVI